MDETATSGISPGGASIGFIGGQGGSSPVFGGSAGRRLLQNGFRIQCLRPALDGPAVTPTNDNPQGINVHTGRHGNGQQINPYATLMRDEWIQFDNVVQQVARERLVVTQALLSRGLRFGLPNAMGTMTLEWEQMVGDLVDAEVTMTGLPEATKDRLSFAQVSMPIPIFHKEWFYNLRHLEAARRNGRNVETNHASEATRKVAELVEKTIFNGLTIAGGNIYGLTTHPLRKTLTVTAAWATATGAQIVGDVNRMVDALALPPNNMEGPYILFVARSFRTHFQDDYYTGGFNTQTIEARIRAIAGIADVIYTSRLTVGGVLVQLSSDVVEIIDGLAPTIVEWDSHAGFQHNFKIFAIQLPRVRANGDGQTGIAHIA
jgi:uncharacterized linocin/CFP29 family protein